MADRVGGAGELAGTGRQAEELIDEFRRRRALGDPQPLSWEEFYRDWSCACVDAFEAMHQQPTVTLPFNVFPTVTAVENPVTGEFIKITRSSPFSWDTSSCCTCGRGVGDE